MAVLFDSICPFKIGQVKLATLIPGKQWRCHFGAGKCLNGAQKTGCADDRCPLGRYCHLLVGVGIGTEFHFGEPILVIPFQATMVSFKSTELVGVPIVAPVLNNCLSTLSCSVFARKQEASYVPACLTICRVPLTH